MQSKCQLQPTSRTALELEWPLELPHGDRSGQASIPLHGPLTVPGHLGKGMALSKTLSAAEATPKRAEG